MWACRGANAGGVTVVVDLEEELLRRGRVGDVPHQVRQRPAHRTEQPVRVAIRETRHAGGRAVHAEPILHGRVSADAVVLLDVAAAQRDALGETDAIEAVLELLVLEDIGSEDVDILERRWEESERQCSSRVLRETTAPDDLLIV